jgi:hypothetical protein
MKLSSEQQHRAFVHQDLSCKCLRFAAAVDLREEVSDRGRLRRCAVALSGLHANSADISVRWTKRHLEVRILSAQPRSREGISGHCAIRIRFTLG